MLLKMRVIVIAHILTLGISTTAAQEWERLMTDYHGVQFIDTASVVVVGGGGVVIRSDDRGATWYRQSTHTHADLWSVRFFAAGYGVAVGDSGVIIRTTDGGEHWMPISTQDRNGLRDVAFSSMSVGYAVGLNGTIMKTTDGGVSWVKQLVPVTTHLTDVSFQGFDNGVAVGDSGVILRTVNGGAVWRRVQSSTSLWIAALQFTDDRNGLAIGANRITLATDDGGDTWNVVSAGDPRYGSMLGVHRFDSTNAVGVGFSAQYGRVWFTNDGGSAWYSGSGPPSDGFQTYWDVACSGDSIGIAVGTNGTIIVTRDRGRTWGTISHIDPGTIRGRMAFANSNVVLMCSEVSYRRTLDGGVTWLRFGVLENRNSTIDVQFVDDSSAFLCDFIPHVFKTTNRGSSWIDVNASFLPLPSTAFAFCAVTGDRAYAACGNGYVYRTIDGCQTWAGLRVEFPADIDTITIVDVLPVGKRYIYATGFGWKRDDPGVSGNSSRSLLYRSIDAGDHWNVVGILKFTGELRKAFGRMYFFDEQHGIVSRSDGVLLTTANAGESWDSVRFSGSGTIADLKFFNDSIGYIVTRYPAGIYRSEDRGRSWNREYPPAGVRLDTTAVLTSIGLAPDRKTILAAGTNLLLRTTLAERIPASTGSSGDERPDVEAHSMRVRPTPTTGLLRVDVENLDMHSGNIATIRVMDLVGHDQLVQVVPLHADEDGLATIPLDCSSLPSGVYILHVRCGRWSGAARAVIMR